MSVKGAPGAPDVQQVHITIHTLKPIQILEWARCYTPKLNKNTYNSIHQFLIWHLSIVPCIHISISSLSYNVNKLTILVQVIQHNFNTPTTAWASFYYADVRLTTKSREILKPRGIKSHTKCDMYLLIHLVIIWYMSLKRDAVLQFSMQR